MSEEFKEEYSSFFKELKKFKEKQIKQKERGLNDYNLLTTVLSADDEVRLHSKMIYSLLNPDGLHYQGSLFLEIFLDIIGFKDEGFDTEKAIVKREYKHIDLYITDGKHHIIIENKIYANDQESQIKGYVKKIIKDNNQSSKDITVIYLSIDRDKPSDYSLGKIDSTHQNNEYFIIKNKELHYQGEDKGLKGCITKFKSIHYKKDILDWLEECKYEIQNITNLNEAIKQYIEVVKIISGKDTSKTKQIKDFLGENTSRIKTAVNIYKSQILKDEDNEKKELIEDVHNNFLKTLDEKYKLLGIRIGKKLSAKFEANGISKIKEIVPFILSTPQKQYASDHYLDLILENGIRIQLHYRNYFKLSRINVYQGNYHKKVEPKHYYINIDFNIDIDDFYKLLTNEEDIKKISEEHVKNIGLIKQLKEAIEYGSNIESLSCSNN